MNRHLKRSLLPMLLIIMVAILGIAGSTYAWFTFRTYTNVTPLKGTVGGDVGLLISSEEDGEFDVECELPLERPEAELLPISTADLKNFFSPASQDINGVALTYKDAADRAETASFHGTVYLKSIGGECDVYLWKTLIDCGSDPQALAAMRLGLIFTTKQGEKSYIFRLDELGDTAGAKAQRTVETEGTVVKGINADGTPVPIADPAESLEDYFAGGSEDEPEAGTKALCTLETDEVASVEFRLYLEGCDDNCINDAQLRDIALQLGFAGADAE